MAKQKSVGRERDTPRDRDTGTEMANGRGGQGPAVCDNGT